MHQEMQLLPSAFHSLQMLTDRILRRSDEIQSSRSDGIGNTWLRNRRAHSEAKGKIQKPGSFSIFIIFSSVIHSRVHTSVEDIHALTNTLSTAYFIHSTPAAMPVPPSLSGKIERAHGSSWSHRTAAILTR